MEDKNRSSDQYSNMHPSSNTAIGIPYYFPSNVAAVGISRPSLAQPQPRIINPIRNQPDQPQKKSSECKECAWLVLFVVVLVAIFLCIDIVFEPSKNPRVEVESMVVSTFNVSNTTSPTITARWNIGLLITNPTKRLNYNYTQIEVSVYYKTEFLTAAMLKPFRQHAKNQTLLKVSSSVLEKQLDGGVSTSMAEDMRNRYVEFNVYLKGGVEIFGSDLKMEASCPPVGVGFLPNADATATGTMLGGSNRCSVETMYAYFS